MQTSYTRVRIFALVVRCPYSIASFALGYAAFELRDVGMLSSNRECVEAGERAMDLHHQLDREQRHSVAGFSYADAHETGFSLSDFTSESIILTAREAFEAAFALSEVRANGLVTTVVQAYRAGFTGQDWKKAGFAAAEAKDAGLLLTAAECKKAGQSTAQRICSRSRYRKFAERVGAHVHILGYSAMDAREAGKGSHAKANVGFALGKLTPPAWNKLPRRSLSTIAQVSPLPKRGAPAWSWMLKIANTLLRIRTEGFDTKEPSDDTI